MASGGPKKSANPLGKWLVSMTPAQKLAEQKKGHEKLQQAMLKRDADEEQRKRDGLSVGPKPVGRPPGFCMAWTLAHVNPYARLPPCTRACSSEQPQHQPQQPQQQCTAACSSLQRGAPNSEINSRQGLNELQTNS